MINIFDATNYLIHVMLFLVPVIANMKLKIFTT